MIVYRIARPTSTKGQWESIFIDQEDGGVLYNLGEKTYPHPDMGPLTAFSTLEGAQFYRNEMQNPYDVLECSAELQTWTFEERDRLSIFVPDLFFSSSWSRVRSFWKWVRTGTPHSIVHFTSTAPDTVWCKWVRPLRQLTREEINQAWETPEDSSSLPKQ